MILHNMANYNNEKVDSVNSTLNIIPGQEGTFSAIMSRVFSTTQNTTCLIQGTADVIMQTAIGLVTIHNMPFSSPIALEGLGKLTSAKVTGNADVTGGDANGVKLSIPLSVCAHFASSFVLDYIILV